MRYEWYKCCHMHHSGTSFLESALKSEVGTMSLKMGAKRMGSAPKTRHWMCSSVERGTVRRECPPYSTHTNWMARVRRRITKKRGLLKKLRKTLISLDLSFLALISLKTCSRTKVWKKRQ